VINIYFVKITEEINVVGNSPRKPSKFFNSNQHQKILTLAELRSAKICRPGRLIGRHCRMPTSFSRAEVTVSFCLFDYAWEFCNRFLRTVSWVINHSLPFLLDSHSTNISRLSSWCVTYNKLYRLILFVY
jgi:hypothetical protein